MPLVGECGFKLRHLEVLAEFDETPNSSQNDAASLGGLLVRFLSWIYAVADLAVLL
jgi:hypothetical protein